MVQGAWIAKALTQQALSHLPGGNQINYFLPTACRPLAAAQQNRDLDPRCRGLYKT